VTPFHINDLFSLFYIKHPWFLPLVGVYTGWSFMRVTLIVPLNDKGPTVDFTEAATHVSFQVIFKCKSRLLPTCSNPAQTCPRPPGPTRTHVAVMLSLLSPEMGLYAMPIQFNSKFDLAPSALYPEATVRTNGCTESTERIQAMVQ
jgi:hypothetical protein